MQTDYTARYHGMPREQLEYLLKFWAQAAEQFPGHKMAADELAVIRLQLAELG